MFGHTVNEIQGNQDRNHTTYNKERLEISGVNQPERRQNKRESEKVFHEPD